MAKPHPKPLTNCYSYTSEDVLRRPLEPGQYLSMRYTERLAEASIEPSVGSRGDSYDCPGRVRHRSLQDRGHQPSWPVAARRSGRAGYPRVGDWFNNRRLLAPIGYVPPVECEEQYYRSQAAPAMLAGVT